MGGGPTRRMGHFTPLDHEILAVQRQSSLYHFAGAQTRGIGSMARPRSCYSSHPPRSKSHHAPLPWPLRADRRRHRARLVWLGRAGLDATLAARLRREANVHLLCPVPWRPGAVHPESPHSRPADRGGSAAALGAHLLRPDLFRQGRPRAHPEARGDARLEVLQGIWLGPQSRRQSPRDRGGACSSRAATPARSRP